MSGLVTNLHEPQPEEARRAAAQDTLTTARRERLVLHDAAAQQLRIQEVLEADGRFALRHQPPFIHLQHGAYNIEAYDVGLDRSCVAVDMSPYLDMSSRQPVTSVAVDAFAWT